MMKTMNASPRFNRLSRLIVKSGMALLLCGVTVAAQSRIIRPQSQPTTSTSARHQHTAVLRASDSPDGSRVALSSDQSLNDYEAYRRGDRFYVKIPQSEVPRAETVRGRGFADVKAQKTGDSTVVSFRLQPGATAHVEQRGNKLDVVFTVPGGRTLSASNGGPNSRSNAEPEANRRSASQKNGATQAGSLKGSPTASNKNSAARNSATSSPLDAKSSKAGSNSSRASDSGASPKTSASKPNATPESLVSTATPESKPSATLESSPRPSPTAKPSASVAQKGSAVAASSPAAQSTSTTARPDEASQATTSLKERVRYWILFAQLNPEAVAIGLGLLLLLIALLILQRRRARGTRRVRSAQPESRTEKPASEAVPIVKPAEAKPDAVSTAAVSGAAAAVMAAGTAAAVKESKPETSSTSKVAAADGMRRDRVTLVSEQAKKVLAGDEYDRSIIGAPDRETRQLVGAELLTGLVGRDAVRRERAREAFMKHGYFDDATRDLRVAESANERAAAARRLSFVHDREATPHLIGALHDASPDVRRAAIEALMDLRDPSAIGPLNTLMQTENDRKVPRTLIKHAIDACATSAAESAPPGVSSFVPTAAPEPSLPVEHEREVIEL
jgi:hypothetical protein